MDNEIEKESNHLLSPLFIIGWAAAAKMKDPQQRLGGHKKKSLYEALISFLKAF